MIVERIKALLTKMPYDVVVAIAATLLSQFDVEVLEKIFKELKENGVIK